ncbi:unnamed protein product [Amoebophrya sp. A120]|nr:unnamed protein product [Amoebophrya sp. A120]|eukprot:GSA120T00001198001.1
MATSTLVQNLAANPEAAAQCLLERLRSDKPDEGLFQLREAIKAGPEQCQLLDEYLHLSPRCEELFKLLELGTPRATTFLEGSNKNSKKLRRSNDIKDVAGAGDDVVTNESLHEKENDVDKKGDIIQDHAQIGGNSNSDYQRQLCVSLVIDIFGAILILYGAWRKPVLTELLQYKATAGAAQGLQQLLLGAGSLGVGTVVPKNANAGSSSSSSTNSNQISSSRHHHHHQSGNNNIAEIVTNRLLEQQNMSTIHQFLAIQVQSKEKSKQVRTAAVFRLLCAISAVSKQAARTLLYRFPFEQTAAGLGTSDGKSKRHTNGNASKPTTGINVFSKALQQQLDAFDSETVMTKLLQSLESHCVFQVSDKLGVTLRGLTCFEAELYFKDSDVDPTGCIDDYTREVLDEQRVTELLADADVQGLAMKEIKKRTNTQDPDTTTRLDEETEQLVVLPRKNKTTSSTTQTTLRNKFWPNLFNLFGNSVLFLYLDWVKICLEYDDSDIAMVLLKSLMSANVFPALAKFCCSGGNNTEGEVQLVEQQARLQAAPDNISSESIFPAVDFLNLIDTKLLKPKHLPRLGKLFFLNNRAMSALTNSIWANNSRKTQTLLNKGSKKMRTKNSKVVKKLSSTSKIAARNSSAALRRLLTLTRKTQEDLLNRSLQNQRKREAKQASGAKRVRFHHTETNFFEPESGQTLGRPEVTRLHADDAKESGDIETDEEREALLNPINLVVFPLEVLSAGTGGRTTSDGTICSPRFFRGREGKNIAVFTKQHQMNQSSKFSVSLQQTLFRVLSSFCTNRVLFRGDKDMQTLQQVLIDLPVLRSEYARDLLLAVLGDTRQTPEFVNDTLTKLKQLNTETTAGGASGTSSTSSSILNSSHAAPTPTSNTSARLFRFYTELFQNPKISKKITALPKGLGKQSLTSTIRALEQLVSKCCTTRISSGGATTTSTASELSTSTSFSFIPQSLEAHAESLEQALYLIRTLLKHVVVCQKMQNSSFVTEILQNLPEAEEIVKLFPLCMSGFEVSVEHYYEQQKKREEENKNMKGGKMNSRTSTSARQKNQTLGEGDSDDDDDLDIHMVDPNQTEAVLEINEDDEGEEQQNKAGCADEPDEDADMSNDEGSEILKTEKLSSEVEEVIFVRKNAVKIQNRLFAAWCSVMEAFLCVLGPSSVRFDFTKPLSSLGNSIMPTKFLLEFAGDETRKQRVLVYLNLLHTRVFNCAEKAIVGDKYFLHYVNALAKLMRTEDQSLEADLFDNTMHNVMLSEQKQAVKCRARDLLLSACLSSGVFKNVFDEKRVEKLKLKPDTAPSKDIFELAVTVDGFFNNFNCEGDDEAEMEMESARSCATSTCSVQHSAEVFSKLVEEAFRVRAALYAEDSKKKDQESTDQNPPQNYNQEPPTTSPARLLSPFVVALLKRIVYLTYCKGAFAVEEDEELQQDEEEDKNADSKEEQDVAKTEQKVDHGAASPAGVMVMEVVVEDDATNTTTRGQLLAAGAAKIDDAAEDEGSNWNCNENGAQEENNNGTSNIGEVDLEDSSDEDSDSEGATGVIQVRNNRGAGVDPAPSVVVVVPRNISSGGVRVPQPQDDQESSPTASRTIKPAKTSSTRRGPSSATSTPTPVERMNRREGALLLDVLNRLLVWHEDLSNRRDEAEREKLNQLPSFAYRVSLFLLTEYATRDEKFSATTGVAHQDRENAARKAAGEENFFGKGSRLAKLMDWILPGKMGIKKNMIVVTDDSCGTTSLADEKEGDDEENEENSTSAEAEAGSQDVSGRGTTKRGQATKNINHLEYYRARIYANALLWHVRKMTAEIPTRTSSSNKIYFPRPPCEDMVERKLQKLTLGNREPDGIDCSSPAMLVKETCGFIESNFFQLHPWTAAELRTWFAIPELMLDLMLTNNDNATTTDEEEEQPGNPPPSPTKTLPEQLVQHFLLARGGEVHQVGEIFREADGTSNTNQLHEAESNDDGGDEGTRRSSFVAHSEDPSMVATTSSGTSDNSINSPPLVLCKNEDYTSSGKTKSKSLRNSIVRGCRSNLMITPELLLQNLLSIREKKLVHDANASDTSSSEDFLQQDFFQQDETEEKTFTLPWLARHLLLNVVNPRYRRKILKNLTAEFVAFQQQQNKAKDSGTSSCRDPIVKNIVTNPASVNFLLQATSRDEHEESFATVAKKVYDEQLNHPDILVAVLKNFLQKPEPRQAMAELERRLKINLVYFCSHQSGEAAGDHGRAGMNSGRGEKQDAPACNILGGSFEDAEEQDPKAHPAYDLALVQLVRPDLLRNRRRVGSTRPAEIVEEQITAMTKKENASEQLEELVLALCETLTAYVLSVPHGTPVTDEDDKADKQDDEAKLDVDEAQQDDEAGAQDLLVEPATKKRKVVVHREEMDMDSISKPEEDGHEQVTLSSNRFWPKNKLSLAGYVTFLKRDLLPALLGMIAGFCDNDDVEENRCTTSRNKIYSAARNQRLLVVLKLMFLLPHVDRSGQISTRNGQKVRTEEELKEQLRRSTSPLGAPPGVKLADKIAEVVAQEQSDAPPKVDLEIISRVVQNFLAAYLRDETSLFPKEIFNDGLDGSVSTFHQRMWFQLRLQEGSAVDQKIERETMLNVVGKLNRNSNDEATTSDHGKIEDPEIKLFHASLTNDFELQKAAYFGFLSFVNQTYWDESRPNKAKQQHDEEKEQAAQEDGAKIKTSVCLDTQLADEFYFQKERSRSVRFTPPDLWLQYLLPGVLRSCWCTEEEEEEVQGDVVDTGAGEQKTSKKAQLAVTPATVDVLEKIDDDEIFLPLAFDYLEQIVAPVCASLFVQSTTSSLDSSSSSTSREATDYSLEVLDRAETTIVKNLVGSSNFLPQARRIAARAARAALWYPVSRKKMKKKKGEKNDEKNKTNGFLTEEISSTSTRKCEKQSFLKYNDKRKLPCEWNLQLLSFFQQLPDKQVPDANDINKISDLFLPYNASLSTADQEMYDLAAFCEHAFDQVVPLWGGAKEVFLGKQENYQTVELQLLQVLEPNRLRYTLEHLYPHLDDWYNSANQQATKTTEITAEMTRTSSAAHQILNPSTSSKTLFDTATAYDLRVLFRTLYRELLQHGDDTDEELTRVLKPNLNLQPLYQSTLFPLLLASLGMRCDTVRSLALNVLAVLHSAQPEIVESFRKICTANGGRSSEKDKEDLEGVNKDVDMERRTREEVEADVAMEVDGEEQQEDDIQNDNTKLSQKTQLSANLEKNLAAAPIQIAMLLDQVRNSLLPLASASTSEATSTVVEPINPVFAMFFAKSAQLFLLHDSSSGSSTTSVLNNAGTSSTSTTAFNTSHLIHSNNLFRKVAKLFNTRPDFPTDENTPQNLNWVLDLWKSEDAEHAIEEKRFLLNIVKHSGHRGYLPLKNGKKMQQILAESGSSEICPFTVFAEVVAAVSALVPSESLHMVSSRDEDDEKTGNNYGGCTPSSTGACSTSQKQVLELLNQHGLLDWVLSNADCARRWDGNWKLYRVVLEKLAMLVQRLFDAYVVFCSSLLGEQKVKHDKAVVQREKNYNPRVVDSSKMNSTTCIVVAAPKIISKKRRSTTASSGDNYEGHDEDYHGRNLKLKQVFETVLSKLTKEHNLTMQKLRELHGDPGGVEDEQEDKTGKILCKLRSNIRMLA